MNTTLLPIFRSRNQIEILSHLFINSPRSFTLPGLVRATGASQPTVWREVERLAAAGLVSTRSVGRNKIVQANPDSPYFPELLSLALKVMGPVISVRRRLEPLPGVSAAYVFGSWARRYAGEAGADPADVDVLVVGDADPDAVDDAIGDLPEIVGRPVNAVVVSESDWETAASPFLRQVKKEPLVEVVSPR